MRSMLLPPEKQIHIGMRRPVIALKHESTPHLHPKFDLQVSICRRAKMSAFQTVE